RGRRDICPHAVIRSSEVQPAAGYGRSSRSRCALSRPQNSRTGHLTDTSVRARTAATCQTARNLHREPLVPATVHAVEGVRTGAGALVGVTAHPLLATLIAARVRHRVAGFHFFLVHPLVLCVHWGSFHAVIGTTNSKSPRFVPRWPSAGSATA